MTAVHKLPTFRKLLNLFTNPPDRTRLRRQTGDALLNLFRADYFASYIWNHQSQRYDDNSLDAMLIPTKPLPARPIEGLLSGVELNGNIEDTFTTYIRNTDPDSNAGLPSVNFPVGVTDQGLPVGMLLGGAAHSDKQLLGIALSLEQLFGQLPPPELN